MPAAGGGAYRSLQPWRLLASSRSSASSMSLRTGTKTWSCSWRKSSREGCDMYLTFFGLAEKPFNTTPDPRFLHMTPGHREALAQLFYGTQERNGFIVLIGKVGTGKTTLLHALRQRLNGQSAISFVVHSTLRFDELLEYVLEDLGIPKAGESRAQRLIALNHFLIKREREGQTTVVIIDEAQNLTSRRSNRSDFSQTSRPRRASRCRSCWSGSRSSRPGSICPNCGSSSSASDCAVRSRR